MNAQLLGSMVVQLAADVSRLKADMAQAEGAVGSSAGTMSRLLQPAVAGFIALGAAAAASVIGITSSMKASIAGAAALNDLAIATNTSVEALSAFEEVGRTSDTTAQQIGQTLNFMARTMASSSEESLGAAKAIKTLGLNYEQFRALKPEDQMLAVAKALETFGESADKTAVVTAIMGRSAAQQLPFLKDLANAQKLQAVVTTEQASAADTFLDNLTLLEVASSAWTKQLAMGITPALSDATTVILGMFTESEGLLGVIKEWSADGTLVEWTKSAMSGVSYLVDVIHGFWNLIKIVGVSVGGFTAAWTTGFEAVVDTYKAFNKALTTGDFTGFFDTVKAGFTRVGTVVAEMGKEVADIWGSKLLGQQFRDRMADIKNVAATADAAKPKLNFKNVQDENAKAAEKARKEYEALIGRINSMIATTSAQINATEDLTASEKLALEIMVELRDGTLKLDDAQKQLLTSKLETLIANEKVLEQDKKNAAWLKETAALNEKFAESVGQRAVNLEASVKAQQEENAAIGLSAKQTAALEAARLRDAAAVADRAAQLQRAMGIDITTAENYERQAVALRKLADLTEQGAARRDQQEQIEELKKGAEQIGQALTNALMEGGKSFGDYMKGVIRNHIARELQALISRAIVGLSGGSGGGFNLTGLAGGGGGGNNMGMVGDLLGKVYGMGSNAWGAASNYMTYGSVNGSLGAVSAPSVYGSMAAGEGIAVSESAAAATSGGSAAGASAAIPIIGWIIAGLMASIEADKQGNNVDMLPDRALVGDHERRKYGHLQKLGFSDKWSNILSGSAVVARAFGHKASETGFGIGSVQGGDFVQDTAAPMGFGKNTLGNTTPTPWLQDAAQDITASIGLTAGMFGGGLTEGMRFGAMTDNDRKGKVSALMGFFGADNKLLSGVQTGSGTFGAGGPGTAASKIDAADLEKWIAEQMPVLIVQGLKQSDLDTRFKEWFDSVGAADLDPEKAKHLLEVATAVHQLTEAFGPIEGVFTQFKELTVSTFEDLADKAGGFDALTKNIGTYYDKFYTEIERTQDAWDSIGVVLSKAGIETIPATKDAFKDLVDSLDLTTEADQKAFASLMQVSGAFAHLIDSADKLNADLRAAIDEIAPSFLEGMELVKYQVDGIARDLKKAGVDINVDDLMGATKADIRSFWNSFVDLSDGASEAEIAVTKAAGALVKLSRSADSLDTRVNAGNIDAAKEAYKKASGFAANATQFSNQWQSGTLSGGWQQYVDNHWGGKANVPGPTQSGIFNAWMMTHDLSGGMSTNDRLEGNRNAMGFTSNDDEKERLNAQRHKEEQDAILKLIESLRELRTQLEEYQRVDMKFGDISTLSMQSQYEESRRQMDAMAAQAGAGDAAAREKVMDTIDRFMHISRQYHGSTMGFANDSASVEKLINELKARFDKLITVAEVNVAVDKEGAKKTINAAEQSNDLLARLLSKATMDGEQYVQ